MVYFNTNFNAETDEEKKKKQGGVIDLSGAPNPVGPNNTQTPVNAPTSSGLFSNLSKFIDANKGKSEQFAGNVAAGTEGKVTDAKSTLSSEFDAFKNKVDSSQNKDDGLLNKAQTTANTLTPDEISKAQNIIKGEYNGPPIFTSEAGINKLDDVKNFAQSLDNPYGRGVAQTDYYDNKGLAVRQGEKSFDNILLNRDVAARDRLAAVKQGVNDQNSGIDAFKNQTISPAQDMVNKVRGFNKDLGSTYQSQLGGTFTGIKKDVDSGVTAANSKADAEYQAKLDALKKSWGPVDSVEGFSWKDDKGIQHVSKGFDRQDGYSIDPSLFVKKGAANDYGNVLTNEQQAKLNALSLILGTPNPYASAGKGINSAFSFDQAAYDKAVADAQANYDNLVKQRGEAAGAVDDARKAYQDWLNRPQTPIEVPQSTADKNVEKASTVTPDTTNLLPPVVPSTPWTRAVEMPVNIPNPVQIPDPINVFARSNSIFGTNNNQDGSNTNGGIGTLAIQPSSTPVPAQTQPLAPANSGPISSGLAINTNPIPAGFVPQPLGAPTDMRTGNAIEGQRQITSAAKGLNFDKILEAIKKAQGR